MTLAEPSPGLLHVLSISTRSPQACMEAVASILGRCDGRMRGFSLKPTGGARVSWLRGISVAVAGENRAGG